MQRRSGNILPPAVDDYPNNSASAWGNPIGKVNTNDPTNSNKGSPPNSSTGRSVALPAAASWGTRTSNSLPLAANVVSANGPSKQKADTHTTLSSSTAVVSSSTDNETLKKQSKEIPTADGRSKLVEYPEYAKQVTNTEHMKKSEISSTDKDANVSNEEKVQKLASDMSSLDIDRKSGLQLRDDEKLAEPLATNKSKNTANSTMEQWDLQNIVREIEISEVEADLLSFNDQRLRDPEVVTHTGYVQSMPQSSHFNNSMGSSSRYVSVNGSGLDTPFVDQNLSHGSLLNTLNLPVVNGNISNLHGDFLSEGSNGHSYFPATEGSRKQMGIFDDKGGHSTAMDLGENSIISNILSMDFDPWGDESLTSPQNLAKLLGDGDKQQGSQRVIGSRKTQNCNQSRFSFAREDGCIHHGSNFTSNSSDFGPGLSLRNLSHDFVSNSDVYPGQLSNGNGFSSFSFEESDRTASNLSSLSFNKIPVSRSQISAPPGFLGPNRAPPPGFTSSERIEQAYDNPSGNDMFDTSSLLRKMHQAPAPVYNGSIGDLEFMDPAILAVGGSRVAGGLNTQGLDMRSNYPSQLPSFETDNGLRFLVQRSFKQQNQRFSELGDNYPQQTDNYGIPSRIVEQTLPNNPNNRSLYQQGSFQQPRSSLMSNGHWDSWNEVQSGNDVAMAELLRNERLGFNKYYSGYEDAQFRLPSSGNVYNRTYGI